MLNMLQRFFLLIVMVCVLAACRRGGEPALVLAVGGAPSELAFWEQVLADFSEQAGIRAELRRQPTDSDQRRQGLLIALKARQQDPDVFLMDVVWLSQFAASNWLYPLDDLAGADFDPSVFFTRVLNLVDRQSGALVALPVYIDGGLLYYRKDLLAEYGFSGPPRTWDELLEQGAKVQAGERSRNPGFWGFVWQGAQYEGLICNFLEFAASGGGGIYRDGGFILSSPANERALSLMRSLIHEKRISPPSTYTQMKEEDVRTTFQSGNALFERNWPYAWPLHQQDGSPVAGKTGIAALPHFPDGQPVSTLGGWHIGVSRYSDMPQQAWELVKYLTSHRVQKRMALELGWNPGRSDLYRDPQVLEEMPHFAELRSIFSYAEARPMLPYYSQISAIVQRHLNAALATRSRPEQALRAAQAEIERVTARYRIESEKSDHEFHERHEFFGEKN